jgi:hypothetical protein
MCHFVHCFFREVDPAGSFETVHAYQTARDHVQEDSNVHSDRRQQVRSHKVIDVN